MKTWKDATIKREMNRLAEGLQEVDKTIISYVRISMGNLFDTRTVTVYTDFAKDEWLFKATFNFDLNTMIIEYKAYKPQVERITSLKRTVDNCLKLFEDTFYYFEFYYGARYESFLLDAKEAEETAEQPKDEQQVTVVENPKLFAEDLVQSLNEAGFATSYKEPYQGTYNMHAMADQGVMVDIDFSEGVPNKMSASAVVYSDTDCIIIDCTKYNTKAKFIKAITENVVSASKREKKLSKATKLFESTDTTDDKVRKLRKEFRQWEILQEREKEADEAYEANYTDKELEKSADEAYEVEYKQYDKIARMIAELINVDVLTAKSMLINGTERVKKILGL